MDGVTNDGAMPNMPAFITKLYWDHGSSSLIPEQDGVPVSDVECRWGIWVRLIEDNGGNTLQFNQNQVDTFDPEDKRDTQLGVYLYYYEQWRLILDYRLFVFGTGVLGQPGYINGYRVTATAFYTSGENSCFFNALHNFTLHSQTSSLSFEDEGGTDPSVTLPTFTFPSTVSYQTVLNEGFNA